MKNIIKAKNKATNAIINAIRSKYFIFDKYLCSNLCPVSELPLGVETYGTASTGPNIVFDISSVKNQKLNLKLITF